MICLVSLLSDDLRRVSSTSRAHTRQSDKVSWDFAHTCSHLTCQLVSAKTSGFYATSLCSVASHSVTVSLPTHLSARAHVSLHMRTKPPANRQGSLQLCSASALFVLAFFPHLRRQPRVLFSFHLAPYSDNALPYLLAGSTQWVSSCVHTPCPLQA